MRRCRVRGPCRASAPPWVAALRRPPWQTLLPAPRRGTPPLPARRRQQPGGPASWARWPAWPWGPGRARARGHGRRRGRGDVDGDGARDREQHVLPGPRRREEACRGDAEPRGHRRGLRGFWAAPAGQEAHRPRGHADLPREGEAAGWARRDCRAGGPLGAHGALPVRGGPAPLLTGVPPGAGPRRSRGSAPARACASDGCPATLCL
mmetsp:Transcript_18799/g.58041  ORF Transcript_18799/g.58041 Transcript_18799/m.58041 type:complete len:207 (+) Transcript_18799:255-875(+)